MGALKDGLVSHAYIIEGMAGVGKKTLTSAFISALLCEDPQTENGFDSCMVCPSCELVLHQNHPDVKYIRRQSDKKAISVSQIREELVGDMEIYPYRSARKIYVIEDADRLGLPAQNAMLKTIEEPPAYGLVILLCENASALLPTILSRCVRITLQPLKDEVIARALMDRGLSAADSSLYTACCLGSLGQALSLASDEDFSRVRNELFDFLAGIPSYKEYQLLKGAEIFTQNRSMMKSIFDLMSIWYRDISIYHETQDDSLLMCLDRADDIRKLSSFYTTDKLIAVTDTIHDIYRKLTLNANELLAIDCLLSALI